MNESMNEKERTMGFIYVLLLFITITGVCCILIFYYNGNYHSFSQKEVVVSKMDRIITYQNDQAQTYAMVDSLYEKIRNYNPGVRAVYEENDIEFMLNYLKQIYETNSYDVRYKSFLHVSEFYKMWYYDKKTLWSKNDNITRFQQNLQECEAGLTKNKTDLNSAFKK